MKKIIERIQYEIEQSKKLNQKRVKLDIVDVEEILERLGWANIFDQMHEAENNELSNRG